MSDAFINLNFPSKDYLAPTSHKHGILKSNNANKAPHVCILPFLLCCDEPSEPPESYPFASACVKKLKELEIPNRCDILVLVKSGEI